MDQPFLLKLILSFLVGGSWTILGTVIAERFGTQTGGVIAGLPSAGVVALFFIGWTQSPNAASEATTLVPAVLGIAAVFNVIYVIVYRLSFYAALLSSLSAWFILTLGLLKIGIVSFPLSLIGFCLLLGTAYFILEKVLRIPSAGQKSVRYTPGRLLFRGSLGGFVVAFAVGMARAGGPILGGVFSVFPAVMLSTIVINHLAHSRSFATAFVKTMAVAGTVNMVVYATAVRYTYPQIGLAAGTGVSFLISLLGAYGVYRFVTRFMELTDAPLLFRIDRLPVLSAC